MFQFTQNAFWFDERSVSESTSDTSDMPQILIKQNTPAETEHNDHPEWHAVRVKYQNTMSSGVSGTNEKNKEKSVE